MRATKSASDRLLDLSEIKKMMWKERREDTENGGRENQGERQGG
jgi:hypothetical protein